MTATAKTKCCERLTPSDTETLNVVVLNTEPKMSVVFFFQAEDGIRDWSVTGVQTCALPISLPGYTRGCHRSFQSTDGFFSRLVWMHSPFFLGSAPSHDQGKVVPDESRTLWAFRFRSHVGSYGEILPVNSVFLRVPVDGKPQTELARRESQQMGRML